jgi:hypothetical protein
MLIKQSFINDADIKSVFSICFATRRPTTNGFRVELERSESSYRENPYRCSRYISLLEHRLKQLSSSPEQKKLCRNYVKELTLTPSLGKRGTFLPFSSQEKGERGMSYSICLLRHSLKVKVGIEKTVIGFRAIVNEKSRKLNSIFHPHSCFLVLSFKNSTL